MKRHLAALLATAAALAAAPAADASVERYGYIPVDGAQLRYTVELPAADGRFPVAMVYDGYCEGTTPLGCNDVQLAKKLLANGYAVVGVSIRGTGCSTGTFDLRGPHEAPDGAAAVQWAARQPWSTGKVGLNGISYYAMNQWQTAALQPPHLAAMCVWEGAADYYRDLSHHGGILCAFGRAWFPSQVIRVQHGLGARGYRSRMNGDWVSGPETLTEEELGAGRRDFWQDCRAHPLASDDYWTSRLPDFAKIVTPLLSSANWGGQGLHPRGNFEGFLRSASKQKWLEVHGIEHWTHFYTDYGVALQKKFFGHFLKGDSTGWTKQPRVLLQVRHPGERFVERAEREWPLARTRWTKFYLDPAGHGLTSSAGARAGRVSYAGLGEGVTFLTPPLDGETEVTGPIAARLWISSETRDADLFLVLRAFTPNMAEVTFQGALDPHTPIAQGWLRASHRKLDPTLTKPWRPYHTHDEVQPLTPGRVYELDVEIWPTSIVVPAGYRIGLTVGGRDYEFPGGPAAGLGTLGAVFTGVGPFKHDDAADRPPEVFGKTVTIHCGPKQPSHVLLPIIPAVRPAGKGRR